MEIIRQRLFIDHASTSQRKITVEYTIRSKLPQLKNIFLNYDKFLPSLLIHDEQGSTVPLISSKDTEILYTYHIENSSGHEKSLLERELKDIRDQKKHMIWLSLKDRPLQKDQIRTFTLTYLPQLEKSKIPRYSSRSTRRISPYTTRCFHPTALILIGQDSHL